MRRTGSDSTLPGRSPTQPNWTLRRGAGQTPCPGWSRSRWVTLPASFAAVIHLLELVGHGVDLAVATEQTDLLDERLCEDVLELLAGMGGVDAYRVPGVFGPEVMADAGAPAHARLAGLLGRHAAPATASAAVVSSEVVAR